MRGFVSDCEYRMAVQKETKKETKEETKEKTWIVRLGWDAGRMILDL